MKKILDLDDPEVRKTFDVLQEFYLKQKTVLKKQELLDLD